MKITLLTIFPSSFDSFLSFPVIRRAIKNKLVEIEVVDIREYADGSFRAIDDSPYGGGRGLILRAAPLCKALSSVKTPSSRTILMGPKGRKFNQQLAHEYSNEEHLVLIAGHYEGVDERFRSYIDEEISIGDYILTGGESAAAIVAEAAIRLLEGALREHSAVEESFESSLLEYPQYTHPEIYDGMKVPEVLLGGNKEEIEKWHEREAILETIRLRPDLISSDIDLNYYIVHKNPENEEAIIRFLDGKLPTGDIIYGSKDFLVLTKLKGKSLKEAAKSKILRTATLVLKKLWHVDASSCPINCSLENTISNLKKKKLAYSDWETIKELEKSNFKEDLVFSHGNLTLDSILANGSGLTGIINFQNAGIRDKHYDLATLLSSMEEAGIEKEELLSSIGMEIDENKLDIYRRIHNIIA